MKIVLDTNVLVSGIFFGGLPGRIIDAWKERRVSVVLSPEIVDEYRRVGEELEARYGTLVFGPILALLLGHSEMAEAPGLEEAVSRDPDDDKFLACALAGGVPVIVSGDNDLLSLGSWREIQIVTPRAFVEAHLTDTE